MSNTINYPREVEARERLKFLENSFKENEFSPEARRKLAKSLDDALLLNVEFVASDENLKPELGLIKHMLLDKGTEQEFDGIEERRMASFVSELLLYNSWENPLNQLFYVDLALIDHAASAEELRFYWVLGHRLGNLIQWGGEKGLEQRYKDYAKEHGTSIDRREYLLGGPPSLRVCQCPKEVVLSEEVETLFIHPRPYSQLDVRRSSKGQDGSPSDYVNLVLHEAPAATEDRNIYLLHFQAGIDDFYLREADERESASIHLFLMFACEAADAADTDYRPLSEEETMAISRQAARIAGLYLLEKTKYLRNDLRKKLSWMDEESRGLLKQAEELLKQLGKVEAQTQILRQSVSSPLERYRYWVETFLPRLFDSTEQRLERLLPYLTSDKINGNHTPESWQPAHVIIALWLLAQPTYKESATEQKPLHEQWPLILEQARKDNPNDPWLYCSTRLLEMLDVSRAVEALAILFKRMHKWNRNRPSQDRYRLLLDPSVGKFLIGDWKKDSAVNSGAKGYVVKEPWHDSFFAGLPILANTVHDLSDISEFRVAFAANFSPEPGQKAVPAFHIIWKMESASGLQRRVQDWLRSLLAAKPAPASQTDSAERTNRAKWTGLQAFHGQNDLTRTILQVLIPDLPGRGLGEDLKADFHADGFSLVPRHPSTDFTYGSRFRRISQEIRLSLFQFGEEENE